MHGMCGLHEKITWTDLVHYQEGWNVYAKFFVYNVGLE